MPIFTTESVGLSRFLSWPGAVSLGLGLGLAVELTLRPSLGATGPWVYALAAVLYLPLLAVWLDLPGEHGPFATVRLAAYPRLGLWAAWLELGGLLVLCALLAQGAATALPSLVRSLFGVELQAAVFLPLLVGAVAVNELIGTRAQSRISTVLVAITALLWTSLFVSVLLAWSTEPPTVPPPTPHADAHQLFPVALLAAILWGPHLLLGRRRMVKDSARQQVSALAVLWVTLPTLGALGLWLASRYPGFGGDLPTGPEAARPALVLSGLGVALCGLGLSQVTASAVRLCSSMSWEGMLPKGFIQQRSERGVPVWPLLTAALATWGLGRFAGTEFLVAGAALGILWTSAVVLWPHLRTPAKALEGRHLPLHPLVPALVVGGCLFLSLVLPRPVLWMGLAWSTAAALFYVAAGRRVMARREREKRVVGDVPRDDEADRPRVLVAAREGPTFSTLVQVGACLACRRQGELLVLKVEPLVEQLPWAEARRAASKTLDRLVDRLAEVSLPEDLTVRPLVRVAPTVPDGILSAASEVDAAFLVVGWPRQDRQDNESDSDPVVEKVFAATHRAMAVVHGVLPTKIARTLVASAGGPHASVALELAEALGTVPTSLGSGDDASSVTGSSQVALLNVITPKAVVAEGDEAIRQTRERRGKSPVEVGEVTVEAGTPVDGIRREVGLQDVLFLGASVDRLLGQTRLGGLATELAAGRPGVTIVVKRSEGAPRFWGRRLWEHLSSPLPPLTDERRAEVQVNMRKAARADVDFYILISLSAAIASLGLMQSSAAVVIGAMLVAPLMSPILAMGHCIVRGHLRLLRRAASSTVKGVGIAVAVGAFFPLVFPGIALTPEILARGAPSLLDLAVALASGAAAAYAVARPSVAAALPGVAIAAALVPPLCVAGIGLGASELSLAGGALLLFTTNLCAIVLAAALIFLMLGFRPRRSHRDELVWRSLALATLGLLMISVPLGLQTRDLMGTARPAGVTAGMERQLLGLEDPNFRVDQVRFESSGEGGMRVMLEVKTFGDGVSLQALEDLRRSLSEETGEQLQFEILVSRVERRLLPGLP